MLLAMPPSLWLHKMLIKAFGMSLTTTKLTTPEILAGGGGGSAKKKNNKKNCHGILYFSDFNTFVISVH